MTSTPIRIGIRSQVRGLTKHIQCCLASRNLLDSIELVPSRRFESESASAVPSIGGPAFEYEFETNSALSAVITDPNLVVSVVSSLQESGHCSKLQWLQSTWAGAEKLKIPKDSGFPDDLVVTRVGRGFGQQMAEYVLGYLIQYSLCMPQMKIAQVSQQVQ